MKSNLTYKSLTFASVKPVSCKKKYFKTKLDPSLISSKATISKPAPSFLKSSISHQIKPSARELALAKKDSLKEKTVREEKVASRKEN
jgi:hypothetical protein